MRKGWGAGMLPWNGGHRYGRGIVALLALCVFALLAAGCGSDSASVSATPFVFPTATTDTAATPTPAPTLAASPSPTGPGAQAGAADICSQPTNITAQPPSSIPAYPGAQLHLTNINGSNGFYGYCSSASVQAIFTYYQQQLPGKGWGNLMTYTISSVQQVKASQGSQLLTVTISPDATLANTTNISITLLAG